MPLRETVYEDQKPKHWCKWPITVRLGGPTGKPVALYALRASTPAGRQDPDSSLQAGKPAQSDTGRVCALDCKATRGQKPFKA